MVLCESLVSIAQDSGMEVVIVGEVNKNLGTKAYTVRFLCMSVLGLLMFGLCSGKAFASGIRLGGASNMVRIIFDLDHPVKPEIRELPGVLSIRFPFDIGARISVNNRFIIKRFVFDGLKGDISIDGPFTYSVQLMEKPPTLIIDVMLRERMYCPVKSIGYVPYLDGISVVIYVDEMPQVLISEDGRRSYLIFDKNCNCNAMEKNILSVPYISYKGMIDMSGGTSLVLGVDDVGMKCVNASFDDASKKVTLHISTRSKIDISERYALARSAYEKGDVSSCIDLLEGEVSRLGPEGLVLLAKAYWKASGSYHSVNERALLFMRQALGQISPGIERDKDVLVYAKMLLEDSQFNDAMQYIQFLKESPDDSIAMKAYLLEIAAQNMQGFYEDAYVSEKRFLNAFKSSSMPHALKGYYLALAGDTYLGLNAYSKALARYREAIVTDADIFKMDPSLYGRIGDAAFATKNYALAKEYMVKAINLGDPKQRLVYMVKLGDCLYRLGDTDGAVKFFSEVEELSPEGDTSIIARLRLARVIMEKDLEKNKTLSDGTYYRLLDMYNTITESSDELPSPLLGIVKVREAQVYAMHGDIEQALKTYHEAWTDSKQGSPIHVYVTRQAQSYILEKVREMNVKCDYKGIYSLYMAYRDSFLKDATDPELLYDLAITEFKLGSGNDARKYLLRCISAESKWRPSALVLLVELDFKTGRYTDALTWVTMYMDKYPKGKAYSDMVFFHGHILERLGREKESIPWLEKVVAMNGHRALDALGLLVDIYRNSSMKDQEIYTLERIISMEGKVHSPLIARAMYLRAMQMMNQGRLRYAAHLFGLILRKYPDTGFRWGSLYYLADIDLKDGKVGLARKRLTTVVESSDDTFWVNASQAYLDAIGAEANYRQFVALRERFKRR